MAKLSRIYKYYRNSKLSLKERFIDSEKESDEIVEKVNALAGKKDLISILKRKFLYTIGNVKIVKSFLQLAILDFTAKEGSKETDVDWEKYFAKYYKRKVSKFVVFKDNLFIESVYGNLNVRKLSSALSALTSQFPELDNEKRYGVCHKLAMRLATSFSQPCFLVTGTIWYLHKRQEFLHSWVEVEKNGKEYVFDTTHNAIFEKDQYYKFFNVDVAEKIKNSTIDEEFDRVAPFFNRNWNYVKLYLASHQEMMKLVEEEERGKCDLPKYIWGEDEGMFTE